MNVTRSFAIAATFAAVAVGAARPAWADQTMSGHYIMTLTTSTAYSGNQDLYFTPCGDGCATVWPGNAQAHLVNGQWTMDGAGPVFCPDNTSVPDALTIHYSWDPNTLAGTARIEYRVAACGQPAGYQQTSNLQFRQAP